MSNFAATVEGWVNDVKGALDAIFRSSVEQVVREMNDLVPVDTGFLRASLAASKTAMPRLDRPHPNPKAGQGSFEQDWGEIVLVINSAEEGETLYLGYTAEYGAHVHYGTKNMAGRPWVTMVAQRWVQIVNEKANEAFSRLGVAG